MTRTIAVIFLLTLAVGAAADDDPAAAAVKCEINAIRNADLIVLARVVTVHRGPEIWCGILATRQDVSWRIEEVISVSETRRPAGSAPSTLPGRRPSTTVTVPKVGAVVRVGHLLVGGGIVQKDYPSVRPDLIHPGARAILLLDQGDSSPGYRVGDETYGVRLLDRPLRSNPDHRAALTALLDMEELAPYLHPLAKGRKPVRIALSKAMPAPIAGLRKFDLPVLFLSKEELATDPFIEVTELTIDGSDGNDGNRARIAFRYDVEGVVGQARLERTAQGFRVVEAEVKER